MTKLRTIVIGYRKLVVKKNLDICKNFFNQVKTKGFTVFIVVILLQLHKRAMRYIERTYKRQPLKILYYNGILTVLSMYVYET